MMDPNYDYNSITGSSSSTNGDKNDINNDRNKVSNNGNSNGNGNDDVKEEYAENISSLSYSISNIKYTSEALLRRLKVWRSSKGFKSPKAPFSIKDLQNFFRRMSFEEGAEGDGQNRL